MDRDKIIDGLKMTMDLCVFDPSTGEKIEPHLLNDISRATYDACKGALEILERLDTDSDTISRQAALDIFDDYNVAVENGQIEAYSRDRKRLCDLPPAQLGTNLAEVGTDCISRQAAIDYFVINVGFHDEDGYPIDDTDELRKIWTEYFDGIPPAQPERIKGHWIKISPANIYECSECGKSVMTNDICAYDFCHGCGAEMEVTT